MKPLRTLYTDVTIHASTEQVWETLYTRFGDVHLYNPSLDGSHFIKGGNGAVGCERQCDLDANTRLVERITRAEELKSFTVEIIGGNMPMVKTMIIDIELQKLSASRTSVAITGKYNTSPGFIGGLVKGMMRGKLTDMLIGLKYYMETGTVVTKQTYKPIARTYRSLEPFQAFANGTR
ncbi:MAG: SRPBCC family protein [Bacteriovoracaceae bacterium]|nr:SRPBCC family protein [Bacteroidota bacterium]